LIVAANQQITQEWWRTSRPEFELYVSQLVVREASEGDVAAAERRLQAIEEVPLLELNEDALNLAEALVKHGPMPPTAVEDALHVAVAAAHGMDYLLTLSFRHIANASMRTRIERVCRSRGYEPPVVCTPQELL
jgi:predicted nucleic acid-binding protein